MIYLLSQSPSGRGVRGARGERFHLLEQVRASMAAPQRGSSSSVVPHRLEGVFIDSGGVLYTKNLVPGEALHDEILISVQNEDGTEVEYREWNPSRSKLVAAILCGVDNIHIKSGSHVLFLGLGDACETTVSHISDIVGHEGLVYVVEVNNGKTLVNMAEKRFNIIPVVVHSYTPCRNRMLVDMVDVMFAGVFNHASATAAAMNATHFLKTGGHYVICVKACCIDSTREGLTVFPYLKNYYRTGSWEFKPMEQVTLGPYDEDHGYLIGGFRMPKAWRYLSSMLLKHCELGFRMLTHISMKRSFGLAWNTWLVELVLTLVGSFYWIMDFMDGHYDSNS